MRRSRAGRPFGPCSRLGSHGGVTIGICWCWGRSWRPPFAVCCSGTPRRAPVAAEFRTCSMTRASIRRSATRCCPVPARPYSVACSGLRSPGSCREPICPGGAGSKSSTGAVLPVALCRRRRWIYLAAPNSGMLQTLARHARHSARLHPHLQHRRRHLGAVAVLHALRLSLRHRADAADGRGAGGCSARARRFVLVHAAPYHASRC